MHHHPESGTRQHLGNGPTHPRPTAAAEEAAKAAKTAARPAAAATSSVINMMDDSDSAVSESEADEPATDVPVPGSAAAAAAGGDESLMDSLFPAQDDDGGRREAEWEAAAAAESDEAAMARRRTQASEELRVYRGLPMAGKEEDPLAWWRDRAAGVQGPGLPGLATLARGVLCIPATSAPAERLFSEAGQTITARRARMKAENAECLTFLRGCWDVVEPYTDLRAPAASGGK
jgi:hypothetical protein